MECTSGSRQNVDTMSVACMVSYLMLAMNQVNVRLHNSLSKVSKYMVGL